MIRNVVFQRENLKFLEYVKELYTAKGLSDREFRIAVYGKKNCEDSFVKDVMRGKTRPADKTLLRWSGVLDVPLETLREKRGKALPGPRLAKDFAVSPTPVEPSRPKEKMLPEIASSMFSLVVGMDGRAEVTLRLTDVPMSDAMRIVEALNSTGLFKPDTPATEKEQSWERPTSVET